MPAGPLGAAGSAPFAVMLAHQFGSRPAMVVDMRTGRVTGRVPVPVAGSSFEWVTAAPGGRAFVLADESQSLIYRFYRLRLGRDGRPLALARLPVPELRDAQIYGLAVTADGRKLAIAWQGEAAVPVHARIEVASLATGSVRIWSSRRGAATALSFDGDAILAFDWQSPSARDGGIRLLDKAAAGADPLASRLLIPAGTAFRGLTSPSLQLVTPDGATIFASMAGGAHGDLVATVAFSARTGRPVRIITPAASTAGTNQQPTFCGVAWTSRTGAHLITQCGTTQLRIDATTVTRIRMPLLPASVVGFANAFAW